jgi:hypothetical protein
MQTADLGEGLPSGEVEGIVDHPPAGGVVAQGVPAIRIRGGLPIFRNGRIEGACGVGGASSHEQEEECARAGIASIRRPRMANCQLARWSEAVIRDQTGYGFYSCGLAGPRGRNRKLRHEDGWARQGKVH